MKRTPPARRAPTSRPAGPPASPPARPPRAPAAAPVTLTAHVAAATRGLPGGPALALTLDALAEAGREIAAELVRAAVRGRHGETGQVNVHGESVQQLDLWANDLLAEQLRGTGVVAVLASEELAEPEVTGRSGAVRRTGSESLSVCFDPIDGSWNLAVGGSVGTVFGVRPGPPAGPDPARAVLGPGTDQRAAGYILYGPATLFVYTVGRGVHGFTLDPRRREFLLTHPDLRMPARGRTYAANEANVARWAPAIRAFLDHLRGEPGRPAPYRLRYVGALVADFHRTLLEGGIYLYPGEVPPGRAEGKLRLLYEAAPLALVAEQAGGRASTGYGRVLDVVARHPHQTVPFFIGSAEEVTAAERHHGATA
jgi:fructose-1,6-bisphosphatase I